MINKQFVPQVGVSCGNGLIWVKSCCDPNGKGSWKKWWRSRGKIQSNPNNMKKTTKGSLNPNSRCYHYKEQKGKNPND